MNSKVLKIIVAIIAVLGIVGFVMVGMAGKGTSEMTSAVDFIVDLAVFVLIALIILTVVLSLFSLVKNPAALKKSLIGLGVLAVLFVISYVLASDAQVLGANGDKLLESGSTSKLSGAGLTFSLILLFVGGVFFVFDLLKSLVKS